MKNKSEEKSNKKESNEIKIETRLPFKFDAVSIKLTETRMRVLKEGSK